LKNKNNTGKSGIDPNRFPDQPFFYFNSDHLPDP